MELVNEKIIEDKYKIIFEEENNRFRAYEKIENSWIEMEKTSPNQYDNTCEGSYYDYLVLRYRQIYKLINNNFPESQFGFEGNGFIKFITDRNRALSKLELKNKLTKKQWKDIHKYKHDYCR